MIIRSIKSHVDVVGACHGAPASTESNCKDENETDALASWHAQFPKDLDWKNCNNKVEQNNTDTCGENHGSLIETTIVMSLPP